MAVNIKNQGYKPLTLDDKPLFDHILKIYQPVISELTFTNLFVWRNYYRPIWRKEVKSILIIMRPKGKTPFGFPVIGECNEDNLKILVSDLIQITNRPAISRMDSEKIEVLNLRDKFKVIRDNDNDDYVYRIEDLIHLSGRKYHHKKNKVNKFMKKWKYEYKPLSGGIIEEILELQEHWCELRECNLDSSLIDENAAIYEALKNYKNLNFSGGAVYTNNKLEAFSLGERLNNNTTVVHFEKANPEIDGLYAVINQMCCKNAWPDRLYVNREQDLGIDGLRRAKQSYHPYMMIHKNILIPNL